MTLGQMSEIGFMLVMPWFFKRLGVKHMLLVGMAAWTARYLLFSYGVAGPRVGMLYAGILFHGICYDFFFVTGQIYVDRRHRPISGPRSGTHHIHHVGVGMFIGAWASGPRRRRLPRDRCHAWDRIWIVPAAGAAAVLILLRVSSSDLSTSRRLLR
jgi:hypothetical protein